MLLCRIYIRVTENVCYKVNISCFMIQGRAIGGPQFVWCDMLIGTDCRSIFLNQNLNGTNTDPLLLRGEEEGGRVAFRSLDLFTLIYISIQCFFNFVRKIYFLDLSAFSIDHDRSVSVVYICQIKAYKLRYTNSGTKKQRQNCQIPCPE